MTEHAERSRTEFKRSRHRVALRKYRKMYCHGLDEIDDDAVMGCCIVSLQCKMTREVLSNPLGQISTLRCHVC